jgi:ketosteroid isomerase-like protein
VRVVSEKLDVARRAVATFLSTGRAPVDDVAPDFVWDFSGFRGWMEDTEYHGPDGFNEQMARWTEPFEDWEMDEPQLIDAGGDDVLAVGSQRGRLSGSDAIVEMPVAQIWTIRDGVLVRLRMFADAADAYAAAGMQPPDAR